MSTILQELKTMGVEVWLDGDQPRFRAPEETRAEARRILAENRSEVIEILEFLQQWRADISELRNGHVDWDSWSPRRRTWAQQRLELLYEVVPTGFAPDEEAWLREITNKNQYCHEASTALANR